MSARAHHAWRYDEDGLQVQIGTELQTYTRTTSKELRALVHSENVNRVPQGTLESYYTAQLLLYGLPPATSVAQAVQSFKSAFAGLEPGYKLKVTESIVAVTKALKAEYRARKQQEESRIQQIQDELDTIAAMKQKEVQLKHELCRPKPSLVSEQSSPSLTSTSGVQPQRESQGSAVPEMEEDLRPQSQKAVESPTKEKKKSKRSREGDHDIQEECSQPESKKIRTAEAPLKALETPPETVSGAEMHCMRIDRW